MIQIILEGFPCLMLSFSKLLNNKLNEYTNVALPSCEQQTAYRKGYCLTDQILCFTASFKSICQKSEGGFILFMLVYRQLAT